jgi:putative PEP-CTERM system TPR-repeat lipoprotein
MIWLRGAHAALAAALLAAGCGGGSADGHLSAARKFLDQQQFSSATIEAKNALQKAPQSAEARLLLGKALLANGETAAAEIELRKARELQRPEVDVVPSLARAMLRQGQFKKIIDEFSTSEFEDKRASADLKTTLAIAHAAAGQGADSERALEAALAAAPDHAPAQVFRARMLAAKGDPRGAEALLDQVIASNPKDATAWKARGDLLRAAGRPPQEALAAFRKAIEIDPNQYEAHADAVLTLLQLDDVVAARTQLEPLQRAAPRHPQTRYLEARIAFRNNEMPAARAALQDVLRVLPDHGSALELAGMVALRTGSPTQAQTHLAKALQQAPHQIAVRRLLAEAYLEGGRGADALKTLQPVLGNTADARSLALAARAHSQLGDVKQAHQLLTRAVKLDPNDVASRVHLAVASMDRGQFDIGLAELGRLAAGDPGTTADAALIGAHIAQKKYDAALKAIDVLERKPAASKALTANLRGRVQLLMRDPNAARLSFERSLAADPRFYPATASLAALDFSEGKVDEARKRLEAEVQTEPRHMHAMLALADLEGRQPQGDAKALQWLERAVQAEPSDVAPRLKLIERHLQAKRVKQALAAAQQALAVAGEHPQVLDALGHAQMAAGDHRQAAATYSKLLALRPPTAPLLVRLAEAQLADNDAANARENLKRALQLKSDGTAAQEHLAVLELKANRPQEAIVLARQIQKARPKHPLGFALEADAEQLRQRYDAAAAAYRNALKVGPASEVASKLHSMLHRTGKKTDADRFAADWVREHPKDARFVYHLGDVALLRGDFAQAEARYRDVLAIAPDNYLALNNVAWTMMRQAKPGALEFAEKANRIKADDVAVMDTLAMVLSQERQHDRAIQVAGDALRLQPQNPLLRLNLARIYIDAGRKDQAKTELNQLAAFGPKFNAHAEVTRLLETLK